MHRPTARILALFAGLALVVSACGGGGSDESSSSGGESLQGSSSGGSGGSGSSDTGDIEFGGDFDGSVQACTEVASAFGSIALGPAMLLIGGEGDLGDVREQLSGQTFRVPAELEEPFRVVDDAYAQIEESLDGVNLNDAMTDPAAMERFEEAAAVFDTDEVRNALEEVSAFLEANCTDFDVSDFGG